MGSADPRAVMAVMLLVTLLGGGLLSSPDVLGRVEPQSIAVPLLGTPQTLNPVSASTAWDKQLIEPIYDSLLLLSPDGASVPWMAGGVVASSNALEWQVDLNQSYSSRMYWHDHSPADPRPVSIKDVAFTYGFIVRHKLAKWSVFWSFVEDVAILNNTTLRLSLSEPYSALPFQLTQIPILPEHIWSRIEAETRDDDPALWTRRIEDYSPKPEDMVGSGPFAFVEYVPGSHAKFTAFTQYNKFLGRYELNATYWARGMVLGEFGYGVPVGPYVDEIVMPIISNPDEQSTALERGTVDATGWAFSPVAMQRLLKNTSIKLFLSDEPTLVYLAFNLWKYPFNGTTPEEIAQTKMFRKSLAYAIDEQQIVSQYLQGLGRPENVGVLPCVFGDWIHPNASKSRSETEQWLGFEQVSGGLGYQYSLTKAASLLDEIGWVDRDGDGFREDGHGTLLSLHVTVPTPTMHDSTPYNAAFYLWSQLRRLPGGAIDVQIEPLPIAQMLSQKIYPRTYELYIGSWTFDPDPDWLYFLFHSSGGKEGSYPNYSNFNMSYFDEIVEAQRATVDTSVRRRIVWEAQEVLADELPYIGLVSRVSPYGYRIDKYMGWVEMPTRGAVDRWSYFFLRSTSSPPYVTLLSIPSTVRGSDEITIALRVTQESGEPIREAVVELVIPQASAYGVLPPLVHLDLTDTDDYGVVVASEGWPAETYSARITVSAPPDYGVAIIPFEFTIAGTSPEPVPIFADFASLVATVVICVVMVAICPWRSRRNRKK